MPAKQNDNDNGLEPLLTAQQEHLSMVITEGAGTDAKALGIAAANIAVLIFIAQANFSFSSWLAHATLLVPFATSLACNILVILPYRYAGPGVDTDSSPEFLAMDRETTILQLLSNTQEAIKRDEQLNKKRWVYCAASLVASAIGTAVLFVIL